mmetsp:Transcript_6486/g.9485  ORF Transcript_6486/g.9485 Transcript_6486/m.9485 type:complete len:175 (-) Transcript_6486:742-1266(-)
MLAYIFLFFYLGLHGLHAAYPTRRVSMSSLVQSFRPATILRSDQIILIHSLILTLSCAGRSLFCALQFTINSFLCTSSVLRRRQQSLDPSFLRSQDDTAHFKTTRFKSSSRIRQVFSHERIHRLLESNGKYDLVRKINFRQKAREINKDIPARISKAKRPLPMEDSISIWVAFE